MDPNATLRAWRAPETRDEQRELANTLIEWIEMGGFEPDWRDADERRALYQSSCEGVSVEVRMSSESAAFAGCPSGEVARILRKLADRVEREGDVACKLLDLNGNLCGAARVRT